MMTQLTITCYVIYHSTNTCQSRVGRKSDEAIYYLVRGPCTYFTQSSP